MAPGREFQDLDADEEGRRPRWASATITALGATAGTNVRDLRRADRFAQRVGHPRQLLESEKIIAGSNNIGGSGTQGMYYSTDGGVTWGQTNLSLASGDSFHSDPTVDWSSDGTAWSTTMGINGRPCSKSSRTARRTAARPGLSTARSPARRPTPTSRCSGSTTARRRRTRTTTTSSGTTAPRLHEPPHVLADGARRIQVSDARGDRHLHRRPT